MPRIVIAGCGFIGLAAARLFHRASWQVLGVVSSAESATALASEPFAVAPSDFTTRDAFDGLASWRDCEAVIHCASSGRGGADTYRRVYLEGARNLIEGLRPDVLLFTSSTSVYAQSSGEWVTEESATEPERETGRVLREAEQLVIERGGCVARLAGIYGPGRSVLLKKFLTGEAVIEEGGSRWINQAHRDDMRRRSCDSSRPAHAASST